jgi:hypothetical protein
MAATLFRRKAIVASAALASALLAVTVPVAAHHSTAMFEWGKEMPMKNLTVE